jgi:hypothetical protein
MKPKSGPTLIIILLTLLFMPSCSRVNNNTNDELTNDLFRKSLVEKEISTIGFHIYLPPHYSIKENEGPDFSVFYFASTDSTISNPFSGGLYFGNFPNEFRAANDSCKIEMMKGEALGESRNWRVYNCDGKYAIQTIINNKSSEGWNNNIHVFGHGASPEDLNKILVIYSTLKRTQNNAIISCNSS